MAPLVYRQLRLTPPRQDWPVNVICRELESLALREAALELLLDRQVVLTLESLAEHGIRPLLMKGSALAYTHYPALGLRPRADTDFLVRESDIAVTEQVLAKLGFVRLNTVSGRFIMHQCTYVKKDGHGVRHFYDVHWKISNPLVFADILSYEELISSAIPVSGLGKHARTLDSVHALLLACLHRIAHHRNSDYLLWLYDIHLLISHMKPEEAEAFARLVRDKQLRAVCTSSLRLAQQCFATPLPMDLMEALEANDGFGLDEVTASFLKPHLRGLDILLSDLETLSHWRDKLCLFKEHVFPPAKYMLNHYCTTNRALLPVLYIHRVLRGAWKLWN
jgi:hypothetical protein